MMRGLGGGTSVKGSYDLKHCFQPSHSSHCSFFPLLVFYFPRMRKPFSAFSHLCWCPVPLGEFYWPAAAWSRARFHFLGPFFRSQCFISLWTYCLEIIRRVFDSWHKCHTVLWMSHSWQEKDPGRWISVTIHAPRRPFLMPRANSTHCVRGKEARSSVVSGEHSVNGYFRVLTHFSGDLPFLGSLFFSSSQMLLVPGLRDNSCCSLLA